eukprot:2481547-Amphidinium_carterae.1
MLRYRLLAIADHTSIEIAIDSGTSYAWSAHNSVRDENASAHVCNLLCDSLLDSLGLKDETLKRK